MCGWPVERIPCGSSGSKKGVSNKDGRLANGLPFVVQDMLPIVMSNHVLHGWAGLVHVRCANQWVIPAVFLGPKDLGRIEVWTFKWPREGIQLTGGGQTGCCNTFRAPRETCKAGLLGRRDEQSKLTTVELTTVTDTEKNQPKKKLAQMTKKQKKNLQAKVLSQRPNSS